MSAQRSSISLRCHHLRVRTAQLHLIHSHPRIDVISAAFSGWGGAANTALANVDQTGATRDLGMVSRSSLDKTTRLNVGHAFHRPTVFINIYTAFSIADVADCVISAMF